MRWPSLRDASWQPAVAQRDDPHKAHHLIDPSSRLQTMQSHSLHFALATKMRGHYFWLCLSGILSYNSLGSTASRGWPFFLLNFRAMTLESLTEKS